MEDKKNTEFGCDGNCASCSGCSQSKEKPAGKSLVIFGILVVICIIILIIVSKIL